MDETDIRRILDAMWDNSIDGRLADLKYGSDFSRQEAELEQSFRDWLATRNG